MINVKIFVALDTIDFSIAYNLSKVLHKVNRVGVKLGLEFIRSNGLDNVKKIIDLGIPIFMDLNLHDIPNTVARVARTITRLAPTVLNVYALGGPQMMRAAQEAIIDESLKLGIIKPSLVATTVLTENNFLKKENQETLVLSQVEVLAKIAKKSGLEGVVCTSSNIKNIRSKCGEDFLLIVIPIIFQQIGVSTNNLKGFITEISAIKAGVNCLILDQIITKADRPTEMTMKILESLS